MSFSCPRIHSHDSSCSVDLIYVLVIESLVELFDTWWFIHHCGPCGADSQAVKYEIVVECDLSCLTAVLMVTAILMVIFTVSYDQLSYYDNN